MKILLLILLAIPSFSEPEKARPHYTGHWKYAELSDGGRGLFSLTLDVVGVFNNQHAFSDEDSVLVKKLPKSLSSDEASFKVIEEVKKNHGKAIVKLNEFYLQDEDKAKNKNIRIYIYMWTPMEVGKNITLIHIKRAESSYMLITNFNQKTFELYQKSLFQLATDVERFGLIKSQ